MSWFFIMQVFSMLLNLARLGRQTDQEKVLQILLLRHQLAILERKLKAPLHISRAEKLTLAVLAARLRSITNRPIKHMADVIRLFQPETVFKWHRELVRRKWTFQRQSRGGRPRTIPELERLIVRLAQENSDWGNGKIEGELRKLGYTIHEDTIGRILKRHDVLIFIEIGSRRVHLAGCTDHPNRRWVTQQARQLVWSLENRQPAIHFLIHDNDEKFVPAFDTVFNAEHIHVIHTPFHAPNANAFAERWVRTVREECLDKLLIINQAHLRRVLREYIGYYNMARPHQGIDQQIPVPTRMSDTKGPIQCRDVLGGILHDYFREVA